MNYFRGNQFTGTFFLGDRFFSPVNILDNKEIEWQATDDSGGFLWPHLHTEKGLFALHYDE